MAKQGTSAHELEVILWPIWFGGAHDPWFLNSGRAIAFTMACLFGASFVSGILGLSGLTFTAGGITAMPWTDASGRWRLMVSRDVIQAGCGKAGGRCFAGVGRNIRLIRVQPMRAQRSKSIFRMRTSSPIWRHAKRFTSPPEYLPR